jgi:paraquat-inducible protein B
MSKQANKTVIGAFVIGAVILVVAGVLVFGSGKFLKKTQTAVLYFQGSVKGLSIGAPVMFRGVKVGSVKNIILQYDPSDLTVYIPVIIETERDRFERLSDVEEVAERSIGELIEHGLKAQLESQSFVTGQLMVNLDFRPNEPLVLRGLKSEYPEIPTVPSDMQRITRTLENIPFEEITKNLSDTIKGIDNFVNSPELMGSIRELEKTLKKTRKFVDNVDKHIDPLVSSFTNTSEAARGAFVQAEKTLAFEEGVPGELASSMKETLASARNTLKQTEHTLASLEKVVADDSGLTYELTNALHEVSAAARAVRFLTDYLDRHPEAMIRGKGNYKGE